MLHGKRPVPGHTDRQFRKLWILFLQFTGQFFYPLKIILHNRHIISIGSHTHKAYNLDTVRP